MLNPAVLEDRAMRDTGLRLFGAEPFEDGLDVLCKSLRDEAQLNASGVAAAEADITGRLSERLRITDWLRRYPEILEEKVAPQIFVVGLPRTGTTALSQFLSDDPGARSVRRWEVACLTPPPDGSNADDPRLIAARDNYEARRMEKPALARMLPVAAEDPSEHGLLLGLTFRNLQLSSLYDAPTYSAWLLDQDLAVAYEYLRTTLQLMQWRTPAQRWNLKNPSDLFALDAVHAVFPEATFVWTHRDPAKAMPSLVSLLELQRRAGVKHLDKGSMARSCLRLQAEGVRRGMAARNRVGEQQFVDVTQSVLERDPIALIERIYDQLSMPFTAEFAARLAGRLAERPRARPANYDLTEYGVGAEEIRDAFADYLARFDM